MYLNGARVSDSTQGWARSLRESGGQRPQRLPDDPIERELELSYSRHSTSAQHDQLAGYTFQKTRKPPPDWRHDRESVLPPPPPRERRTPTPSHVRTHTHTETSVSLYASTASERSNQTIRSNHPDRVDGTELNASGWITPTILSVARHPQRSSSMVSAVESETQETTQQHHRQQPPAVSSRRDEGPSWPLPQTRPDWINPVDTTATQTEPPHVIRRWDLIKTPTRSNTSNKVQAPHHAEGVAGHPVMGSVHPMPKITEAPRRQHTESANPEREEDRDLSVISRINYSTEHWPANRTAYSNHQEGLKVKAVAPPTRPAMHTPPTPTIADETLTQITAKLDSLQRDQHRLASTIERLIVDGAVDRAFENQSKSDRERERERPNSVRPPSEFRPSSESVSIQVEAPNFVDLSQHLNVNSDAVTPAPVPLQPSTETIAIQVNLDLQRKHSTNESFCQTDPLNSHTSPPIPTRDSEPLSEVPRPPLKLSDSISHQTSLPTGEGSAEPLEHFNLFKETGRQNVERVVHPPPRQYPSPSPSVQTPSLDRLVASGAISRPAVDLAESVDETASTAKQSVLDASPGLGSAVKPRVTYPHDWVRLQSSMSSSGHDAVSSFLRHKEQYEAIRQQKLQLQTTKGKAQQRNPPSSLANRNSDMHHDRRLPDSTPWDRRQSPLSTAPLEASDSLQQFHRRAVRAHGSVGREWSHPAPPQHREEMMGTFNGL
jgi:hypothetical protein